eukprot:366480-Chlamydomonas_euryale.AAC.9
MAEWVDRGMDGWMDGWTDGWTASTHAPNLGLLHGTSAALSPVSGYTVSSDAWNSAASSERRLLVRRCGSAAAAAARVASPLPAMSTDDDCMGTPADATRRAGDDRVHRLLALQAPPPSAGVRGWAPNGAGAAGRPPCSEHPAIGDNRGPAG